MSSALRINNKDKDILILGKGSTSMLDYITWTAEAEYSINFTKQGKKFCVSLHYNGRNIHVFVNRLEI